MWWIHYNNLPEVPASLWKVPVSLSGYCCDLWCSTVPSTLGRHQHVGQGTALLGSWKLLFLAEKEGGEMGEISKNTGADFKLQLQSSCICIWSPVSCIQTWTWPLGFLAWLWSCVQPVDFLGCVWCWAVPLEPLLAQFPVCFAISCSGWSFWPSLHPPAFGASLLVKKHLKFSQIFLKCCCWAQSKPREGMLGSWCDTAVGALFHD